jgi:MoaA/NifB/PqqE/SkfB family radical SAM enzyme
MKERGLNIREHLSSDEYTFYDGVFFVPGAVRGAIYDLNSSNVYSINQSGCDVLTGASENPEFWRKLETVWRSTKDNVLVCQDCEYKYACFDCRPLSEGANQGRGEYLSAPYPRCTYNPYSGEWAKGVWRVDEDGKPYYDETLRPEIEEFVALSKAE